MQIAQNLLAQSSYCLHREWLEADGLGGYAGMSIAGALTRRYHGLLCVPMRELGERHVLVSKLMPVLTLADGQVFEIDCNLFSANSTHMPPVIAPAGYAMLETFWIDEAPHWEFRCGKALLQITVVMPRGTAASLIEYKIHGADNAKLELRPLIAARSIHKTSKKNAAINQFTVWSEADSTLTFKPYLGYPSFHIKAPAGTRWQSAPQWWNNFFLQADIERGFDGNEDLHSPGSFTVELSDAEAVVFACCAPGVKLQKPNPDYLNEELTRRRALYGSGKIVPVLRRAAEQFLTNDTQGHFGIVAGYPWFERWGRDTLISLHSLTNILNDQKRERAVIEHQLSLIQDGLIPNLITEGGTALYNSIDAVLWLFVSAYKHFKRTEDSTWIARTVLPTLRHVVKTLQSGTQFNIFVGNDALLSAGSGNVQLTWMDAKINGWPVTPRHGKAVEINALWFNVIKILAEIEDSTGAALSAHALAAQIQRSFCAVFIKPDGSLRDVVGDEELISKAGEVRPNQIFALSLPFPILEERQAEPVLKIVREELLTARGLRTLSPNDPHFCTRYAGNPEQRDSAYHQGTVWPWLFGPYAEALSRYGTLNSGSRDELAQINSSFETMLGEGCLGSIAEVYDATTPQYPGGCFAQAWSVAAACLVKELAGKGF